MASKSNKGEILAKFFDDGEYTALFADGAASQHNDSTAVWLAFICETHVFWRAYQRPAHGVSL